MITLSGSARFARAIRGLARDAHRTLAHAPSPAALRGLPRRIERLASALRDRREGPLGTWLKSLGREVRSAAVYRAGSARLWDRHAENRRRESCPMSS
jgi:hypothetical protein